jgi:rSAM/selenodomain-associated transferase 2
VGTEQPWLSVIVPARNEQDRIGLLLRKMQDWRAHAVELIVVDGGSLDQTVAVARPLADHCIVTRPGRADQQNAGAALARGELLWFVHADSGLQGDEWRALQLLQQSASTPFWGRFDVRMNSADRRLKLVATMMNLRSRVTGVATGDQGIFVSRELFFAIGGFPQQPLMEDVEISTCLSRISAPICLRETIMVDGRRWQRRGVWRTVVQMWWLRLRYFLGADPVVLHREYYRD